MMTYEGAYRRDIGVFGIMLYRLFGLNPVDCHLFIGGELLVMIVISLLWGRNLCTRLFERS